MSLLPRPNNVKSGFGTSTPTHIYGQQPKKKSDTVTVSPNFFNAQELPRRRNRPGRGANYNQMRKYHNLPSIRRLGRRRGSVARGSATGSVEGGKRTRKHNKKHKKTKKRRGKKRRTMRR